MRRCQKGGQGKLNQNNEKDGKREAAEPQNGQQQGEEQSNDTALPVCRREDQRVFHELAHRQIHQRKHCEAVKGGDPDHQGQHHYDAGDDCEELADVIEEIVKIGGGEQKYDDQDISEADQEGFPEVTLEGTPVVLPEEIVLVTHHRGGDPAHGGKRRGQGHDRKGSDDEEEIQFQQTEKFSPDD